MLNYRTLAVIKRELREKLLSKGFIIMTIALPVLMFGILGIQALLMTYEGEENTIIHIVGETDDLTKRLNDEFEQRGFVTDGSYNLVYKTMDRIGLEEHIKEIKDDLISDSIRGIVFVPSSALENKDVEYYSKTPKNITIIEKIDGPINKVLVESYFDGKDLSEDDLLFARSGVDVKSFKVAEGEEIEEEGYGNLILAYLFSFLLYISLLMMGTMTMQSVVEEKNNRINEILLSSVSSKELMAGKILGASITGVLQMAIWLLPVITLMSTTIFVLPPEVMFSISSLQILYLLLNFFLGLITFLGLFATVGSIFENAQETQSGMWPVMLLIIIPFFIALSMVKNPNSPIAEVASMAPFASIIVMPARMTLTSAGACVRLSASSTAMS